MEYVDGPSGQERCLGSYFMITIAYQAIDVEKIVFGDNFQGSRQVLLNTLVNGMIRFYPVPREIAFRSHRLCAVKLISFKIITDYQSCGIVFMVGFVL